MAPKKENVCYNKNHRLELIDEDGNQRVRIETAEGKKLAHVYRCNDLLCDG